MIFKYGYLTKRGVLVLCMVWLFTVEENVGVTLINPFSGSTIGRPPIMDLPNIVELPLVEYQVFKAILSVDPALSPDDYIVTAIYDDFCRLAFFQPGDKAWTYLENTRDGASKDSQVEIIAPRTEVHADHTYLVESSSGDLLIVQRFMKEIGDDLQHETSGFEVFKLLLLPNKMGDAKRIRVKSLGGDTMFLLDSHSTCISASNFRLQCYSANK
ncbi:uncharacterized protein LOC132271794 isoform X2 [Cornus florida]|uniref:uncharacterized protein LOC132271794 isoform X2 n=1 Tax=Cornus florida TaxID=4283 RepID=UPI002899D1B3|nr:uncharacterized protein LOC132271794 isoform X2 [Cornus florida]